MKRLTKWIKNKLTPIQKNNIELIVEEEIRNRGLRIKFKDIRKCINKYRANPYYNHLIEHWQEDYFNTSYNQRRYDYYKLSQVIIRHLRRV